MKKQFVGTLQEGDVVNDYFLAARKDLRDQSSGGKFLGMVFKDRTGEIGGILWSNALSVSRLFEVGDVVNVRGTVTSYQDRLQIRVDQVLPLKEEEYDPAQLVVAPANTAEILAEFRQILGTIKNEWLVKLVNAFLDDQTFTTRFSEAAAGKKWHHAHPGGLVRHCCEVARIALTVCDLFPNIDRDLLLTAVFLHDLGKLDEMSQDLLVDYTAAGKLIGHIEIGAEMVRRKIDAMDGFPESLRLHLLHCVLSHHGELVNGSPVVPKTLEAMVLYHCDNLDAQADAITRVIKETREKHQEWSEFIPLIDRQVWARL
jgi:3'-5' exoribonuclease